MLKTAHARAAMLALAAAATLAACSDDDPAGPTSEEVAGSYVATTFTITSGGGVVDLLESGSTLELTLDADGTTAGRLFIPDLDAEGDFDVDLTGTFVIRGDRIEITTGEDVFIDDVDFRYRSGRLTASFSGTEEVVVVLERQ